MKKPTLALVTALAFASTALSQTLFRADLTGDQEVPPVVTLARGYGSFTLNADSSVTYLVKTLGLTGTAAHIHDGGVGAEGPPIITLSGGPTTWSGTSAPLTGAQVTKLRTKGLYANVHTAANGDGEVRGQIEARPAVFGAYLNGAQEVPPVNTAATGQSTFVVNADMSITYLVTTTSLSNATVAHIHTGDIGVVGAPLFTLTGGPTTWMGTTAAMSVTNYNDLQDKGLYVNVHTSAFTDGEIRGQLLSTGIPYGSGCASSTGSTPMLTSSGAPTPGGSFTLMIDNGKPFGFGLLLGSLSQGALLSKGCPFFLGATSLVLPMPLLDASGDLMVPVTMPALPGSVSFNVQYLGADVALMSGQYVSNGLEIPLFVFP